MQDINTLITQKLQKNMLDTLRSDLIKYAHFCPTTPEYTLNAAIQRMTSCDYNLSELLGCQNLFYNHKALAKKLFGPTRFNGVPAFHQEEYKFMRIMPVGNSHIAYALNLPTCILMSALMGTHRRDWRVQVNFCKTVTSFMMENLVPYSLVPVNEATMDSFETLKGVINTPFVKKHRPLQFRRNGYDQMFIESSTTTSDEKQSDGTMDKALVEDCAHMGAIIDLASELEVSHYWMLPLTAWNFEIAWGANGSVTPLRPYKNNTSDDTCEYAFTAQPNRCAFVKVAEDNSLILCVTDPDTGEVSKMSCGTPSMDRSQQQQKIWAHGWGPAYNFRRCGVLLHVPDSDTLLTLIPFNVDPTNMDTREYFDGLVRDGWNHFEFFKDGYYLASDGLGQTHKFTSVAVEEMVVSYGSHIAISNDCPHLTPYKTQHKIAHITETQEQNKHPGSIAAWHVAQDFSVPSVCTVPVIVKMLTSSKKIFAQRMDISPNYLQIFPQDDGQLSHKGCHPYLIELLPLR